MDAPVNNPDDNVAISSASVVKILLDSETSLVDPSRPNMVHPFPFPVSYPALYLYNGCEAMGAPRPPGRIFDVMAHEVQLFRNLDRLGFDLCPARLCERGEHRQHQVPDRCVLLKRRAKIGSESAALIRGLRLILLSRDRDSHHRRNYQHHGQDRKSSQHGFTPSVTPTCWLTVAKYEHGRQTCQPDRAEHSVPPRSSVEPWSGATVGQPCGNPPSERCANIAPGHGRLRVLRALKHRQTTTNRYILAKQSNRYTRRGEMEFPTFRGCFALVAREFSGGGT